MIFRKPENQFSLDVREECDDVDQPGIHITGSHRVAQRPGVDHPAIGRVDRRENKVVYLAPYPVWSRRAQAFSGHTHRRNIRSNAASVDPVASLVG